MPIMKCTLCGIGDAFYYLVDIIDGEKIEYHICTACLKKTSAYKFNIEDVLNTGTFSTDIFKFKELKCDKCGMTWAQFIKIQRLGCPNDYIVFSELLSPILERYHNGSQHIGKVPLALISITKLKDMMNDAIQKEDYELAAKLRDMIKNGGK
jgi:protein arginine kinase activator